MICPNCGNETGNYANCYYCGAQVQAPDSKQVYYDNQPPQYHTYLQQQQGYGERQYPEPPPLSQKPKKNIFKIVAIVEAAVIVIMAVAMIRLQSRSDAVMAPTDNAPQSVEAAKDTPTPEAGEVVGGVGLDNDPTSDPISEPTPVISAPLNGAINDEILPMEIMESSYFSKKVLNKFYIQYAVVLRNPNRGVAVLFPSIRITARDASGAILATDEQVFSEIAPETTIVYASQGPSVDAEPANVEFEEVPPKEYNIVSPELTDYPNLMPLEATNLRQGENNITGEILNNNDFSISSACVTVVFRDDSNKLISGDRTFIDAISAGGSVPFEIRLSASDREYVTSNFEVFAYPW